jgi:hypothetical protein
LQLILHRLIGNARIRAVGCVPTDLGARADVARLTVSDDDQMSPDGMGLDGSQLRPDAA